MAKLLQLRDKKRCKTQYNHIFLHGANPSRRNKLFHESF